MSASFFKRFQPSFLVSFLRLFDSESTHKFEEKRQSRFGCTEDLTKSGCPLESRQNRDLGPGPASDASPTKHSASVPLGAPSTVTQSSSSSAASESTPVSTSSSISSTFFSPTSSISTPSTLTPVGTSSVEASAPSQAQGAVSHSNAGTIAGGVVGGALALLAVVICLIVFRRRARRNRIPPSAEFMYHQKLANPSVLTFPLTGDHEHAPPDPPPPFARGSFSERIAEKANPGAYAV